MTVSASSLEDPQFARRTRERVLDLMTPKTPIYWLDLGLSTLVGYTALICAIKTNWDPARVFLIAISIFALYRSLMFIHELAHLGARAPKGFWLAWNALIGIPFFLPSFFYDGVHGLHHGKHTYGTALDPEYFPFNSSPKREMAFFVIASITVPILLVLRSTLAVPLAAFSRSARQLLLERGSSLMINLNFVRPVEPLLSSRSYIWLEISAFTWGWTLIALVYFGWISHSAVLIVVLVATGVALINQLRTLVSHRWESRGNKLTPVEQMVDTVNVPPPAMLPALWAPLGLRYHALHHFLPELPYHSLGEAHRRAQSSFPGPYVYDEVNAPGFWSVVKRIWVRDEGVRN